MAVTSSTIGGVNTWTFSGVVTDAQINTAWAALITNGVYVLNRAIYLDSTADLTSVTGGFLVDFGTQVLPAFILHTARDKTKSTFKNFTFLQRTGLTVPQRVGFVQTWNGTTLANQGAGLGTDGLSLSGGGFIYGVSGNSGVGDSRYLNEMPFTALTGATIYSQEFAEQELQICAASSNTLKGITFEKCYGFPQLGTPSSNVNVVVYRSTQNTQSTANGGLIPIRLFPSGNRYASVCYVDSYVTRNNSDINTRLIDTFGSNATNVATIMILNNYTRESWFGAAKTNIPVTTWPATNFVYGGVLKKLKFVGGENATIRCYDSRSTTTPQKCSFQETGTIDFLDTSLAPTTDVNGQISLVHIGAIATGAGAPITRYTNQRYTYQKFGQRVSVTSVDMTQGGDNDLSAFTPVVPTTQEGLARTQAAINASTTITSFQDLLEELHVLAIGLTGSVSYAGAYNGNLFNYTGTTLTTSFATVTIDPLASSKITYDPVSNALTIKAANLESTASVKIWDNASGAVNLTNSATIQGLYVTSSGLSSRLILSNLVNSTIYIADNSGNQYQLDVNQTGTFTGYTAPGATGTWTWIAERYGYKRITGTFTPTVGGDFTATLDWLTDGAVTETNPATVADYTELGTLDKLYDYAAYYRTQIPTVNLATKDGITLDFGATNIDVNSTAAAVWSYNSGTDKLTIKTSILAAGTNLLTIKSTDPITFLNGATATCIYIDDEGSSTNVVFSNL